MIRVKAQTVLREDTRELTLLASGVEGCLEGDRTVTDIHADESASEVIVKARLKIGSPLVCDEYGTAGAPFVVKLRMPLSGRTIVDGSNNQPVSTVHERRQVRQALSVKSSQAESFLAQQEPELLDVKCYRAQPERFQCQGRDPGSRRLTFVSVFVQPGARLRLGGQTIQGFQGGR